MCLAVPMKLSKVSGVIGLIRNSAGVREIDLSLVPSAKKGDYLLVHAGFAIEKVDPAEAKKTLKVIRFVEKVSREIR